MSGWRLGEVTVPVVAQRLGTGEGRETKVRVTLGAGHDDHRVIEIACWREVDGTLVMRLPDGRLERAVVSRDGLARWVSHAGKTFKATELKKAKGPGADHHQSLEAPMPGKVTKVLVKAGDAVKKGQTLLTVEAMKMEHALKAPRDGWVEALRAEVGQLVSPGTPLVVVGDQAPEGAS